MPDRYRADAVPPAQVEAVRQRYGVAPGERLLLFVGRLTGVKGVVPLVEAMPQVLARNPAAKLVILGRGELEWMIEERVRQLGLEERIALRYEFVSEDERIAHFAACDLAVFPSTYEPFGIVCLEAMSMGKPVVVGAKGVVGFREQVVAAGPLQNGQHVDGGNPHDIAWGINLALSDPDRLTQWGAHSRQRVLDHFTWAHAAAKTEAIYRQLTERAAGTTEPVIGS
jgi:glycosyltransferase involved in cell wall biosynthesis